MKASSETPTKPRTTAIDTGTVHKSSSAKPPFRRAKDDSKPLLQDPISRSDPIETEEAVLRLPPLPNPAAAVRSSAQSNIGSCSSY